MKTTAKQLITAVVLLFSITAYSQTRTNVYHDFSKFKNDVVNSEFLYKMLTQDSASAVKNYDYYASFIQDTAKFKVSLGRDFQFDHCGFRKFYFDLIIGAKVEEVEYYNRYVGGANAPVYVFRLYKNGEHFNSVAFVVLSSTVISSSVGMLEFLKNQ
jgi:hypothetical protein